MMFWQRDGEKGVLVLRASPRLAIAVAALLLATVGWLDFVTGKEISFTIIYLIPVSTAAWIAGRRVGLVFCILAAACELAAEFASEPPNFATAFWNAGVKFGVYFVFCALLDIAKTHSAGANVLRTVHRRIALGVALGVSVAVMVAVSQRLFADRRVSAASAASSTGGNSTHTSITSRYAPVGEAPVEARKPNEPLADLAKLVTSSMHASRPALLGSRDPNTTTCVQVVRSGDVISTLPRDPSDLNGGPGTTLATIFFIDREHCKSAMADFSWHQGRLKTFLQNEATLNRPAAALAHELADKSRQFWELASTWSAVPGDLTAAGFESRGDWPSFCMAALDRAAAAKDLTAVQHWSGELATAAFSLDDLHRWLNFLVENHLTALEFQQRCETLFRRSNDLHEKYDPSGTLSQFPAGVLGLNGKGNYYEVEHQAELLFAVPRDQEAKSIANEYLTPSSLWVSPNVRETFVTLQNVLSPENRKTWELAARMPFEHSYLINMLYRADRVAAADELRTVLKKFDAMNPHAQVGELLSVIMYRGHSFAGLEWADRFRPELVKAADHIGPNESDVQAMEDACRWTNQFYQAPTEYGMAFTLRDALLSHRLDCVRATDMIGAIYRNAGRVGFGHIRWCCETGGHSVAAYLRPENDKPQARLFDGLMPPQKPETWPDCYFHGHAWPPSLEHEHNPTPYAVEMYVRGIDSYIWAEGYIVRGPNAGWLTTAAIPYSSSRREASTRKVFDGPYPE
jgi:hypothetical protein